MYKGEIMTAILLLLFLIKDSSHTFTYKKKLIITGSYAVTGMFIHYYINIVSQFSWMYALLAIIIHMTRGIPYEQKAQIIT